MKVKGWLAAAVVAALLGGFFLVGVTSLQAYAAGDTPAGQAVSRKGCGHMSRGMGDMEDLAGFIGISEEDLLAARQSGKSIVQIASEKGITEQQLVDHMMEKINAKVDQKAADGKITSEQAQQMKQSMAERVKERLNSTDPDFNGKGKMGHKGRGMGDLEDLAGFIGISEEDLLAARQSGKSVVQIASEKGITEQQLVDHVMEKINTKVDQKAADGKITAEQAEQLKQSMAERIKERLNSTDPCPKGPEKENES